MPLSTDEKRVIGREIRQKNSGIVENRTCQNFNLVQIGGSQTKVDGRHSDGSNWSIKNTKSSSTQVHLTTQSSFSQHFSLNEKQDTFVRKFFGNISFLNKERHRYKLSEINEEEVNEFKFFLEKNKIKLIHYFISGESNINFVVYNNKVKSTEEILKLCESCYWKYNETTIQLKDKDDKTLFHIQMKGSGNKSKMGYHGVLCHIHNNVFV
tara:strand:- start:61 stop:690 length:630 start_codon:yes stop_codon:yes gene_type:complete